MNPEKEEQIRHDAMTDLARDSAVNEMKEWFLRHYENPAVRTPYESAEGGYIYIWGGPYRAADILEDQFASEYPEDLIGEAVKELERESQEWTKIPTAEDYEVGDASVSEYLDRAQYSLQLVRSELAIQNVGGSSFVNALLFAHVISVLEAFLAEAFASKLKDPKVFRKFIETDPAFQKASCTIAELYKEMESIQARATEHLQSILYHRLEVVQRMFKASLGIDLPPGIGDLLRAVQKRHDIVHRNCKDKQGVIFQVTAVEVTALIDLVDTFIENLAASLET